MRRPTSSAVLAACVFLLPAIAFADPAGGHAPEPVPGAPQVNILRIVLGLGAALILAVLAAHPFVRTLERRLGLTVLLSSGIPFIAMGVIFRMPSVGILSDEIVADLRPALEFGLGWLGFVVGIQFDVRELDLMPEETSAAVVAESAIPFLTTVAASVLFLMALDPTWSFSDWGSVKNDLVARAPLRDALALGACATMAAPVAAVAIARSSGSMAARIVEHITRLDDIAGIVVLALIGAFYRPTDAIATWSLPHIAWIFIELGLGGVLGILTYILIRSAKSGGEEIASLLGSIALSAGMAGYLGLSPLVVCAIAGALLINLPYQNVERLKATLAQVERPLYMILLVIAGALWDPTAWQGWALVPIFVAARVAGKIMGARVAKRVGPKELPDATTLGLALSPQSPVAIATIVSYYAIYRTQTENAANLPWLMTATIGGAVLTELTVQILVRMRGGLRFELGSLSIPPPSVRPVAMVNDPGHEPAIPTPAALPKIADPSSDQGEGY